jgi:hypothetical protein
MNVPLRSAPSVALYSDTTVPVAANRSVPETAIVSVKKVEPLINAELMGEPVAALIIATPSSVPLENAA